MLHDRGRLRVPPARSAPGCAAPPAEGGRAGAFHDPAFAANKSRPVHRWVPWIAGFSREFVAGALARHLERPSAVLDPFCGVGTTLVEAMLAGHRAVGFEINPYAALASRTKAGAHEIDPSTLERTLRSFLSFYASNAASAYQPRSRPPQGFRTRGEFYSPAVLRKVLIVLDFVETIGDPRLRDLFRVAFASTMVGYSNYSYEPSLGRRASAGRSEVADFAVGETIGRKLHEMADDVRWLRRSLPEPRPPTRVVPDSFFRAQDHLEAGSIDLLITSPPYLNNYHYNRNTRPHLYWLGFVARPGDMRPLEEQNFGKFWQTVRELERVDLEFPLPGSGLPAQLEEMRALNATRGVYGGNGWANYAAGYFNDCHRFATAMGYVLRPGGTALVVIGNSIVQGLLIPTDRYLGEIAQSVGLRLVALHVPRATRVGNSIIQSEVRVAKAERSHRLYEAVVELRRE
jgi:hypothetical protein